MLRSVLHVGVACLFPGVLAHAADLAGTPAEPTAPVVVPYNWTGLYLGGQAGYGWADTTIAYHPSGGYTPLDPKGTLLGGQIGYDYQFDGGFVIGAEADMAWNRLRERHGLFHFANGEIQDNVLGDGVELHWTGAVRLRAGFAFDRLLPYVVGGVAFGGHKATVYDFGDDDNVVVVATESATLTGWTIGAGLDYAMTENLIVGVEYRYTDFGKKTVSAKPFLDAHDYDFSSNDVRLGLNYKF